MLTQWFSRNFYNPAWTGPRRIKNMIMLLEVIPNLGGGSRAGGEDKQQKEAADEEKRREKEAGPVIDLLWSLFASKDGKLAGYAVQQVLRRVLHVENVDEKDVSRHVEAAMKALEQQPPPSPDDGAAATTGDLTDKKQLSKLLFGQSTRGGLADRHFVAITLREAEVRRETLAPSSGWFAPCPLALTVK